MKLWAKVFSACLASWIFLAAIGVVLGNLNFWGARRNPVIIIIPLSLAFLACFLLAWVNIKSFRKSVVGALGGIVIGLPMSYLLLVPFGYWFADWLFPLSNLDLSGSLGGSWFLLGVVVIVEILTDQLHLNNRWLMMILSSIILMILIYIAEWITAPFGITNDLSLVKLMIYAPLIWGGVVGLINTHSIDQNCTEKGENNEHTK